MRSEGLSRTQKGAGHKQGGGGRGNEEGQSEQGEDPDLPHWDRQCRCAPQEQTHTRTPE